MECSFKWDERIHCERNGNCMSSNSYSMYFVCQAFIYIRSQIFKIIPLEGKCFYSKETESEKLNSLPKVTKLLSDRSRI